MTSAGRRLVEHGVGLGGGGAGAEVLQPPVGDPEDVGGVGAAHGGQAAALTEQGEGVLEGLAVGMPAVGGVGVEGGGGLGVAGGLGPCRPGAGRGSGGRRPARR